MPPIQFAVQSYQSRSLDLSAQRLVNLYAESAPADAKAPVSVFGSPGIRTFATAGVGPIRGMHVMGSVLYVVSGTALYSVTAAAVATNLGSIAGVGRVSMADNGTQLCIVNGAQGYIYTTSGGLVQITDPDFQAADTVTYQDGYFIFSRAGTGQFFISALNDGTAYSATDFATAEGNPDNLVAVKSNHRELCLLGEKTMEFWFNSGDTFPFDRISGSFQERGCAAAHSVADEDNTLFWLADDLTVRRAEGYRPVRISTHAMEDAIEKYTNVSEAFGFFYTIGGHKLYHLTFPNQATWVYDIATGMWHERESFGLSHWRANSYASVYGTHLVGDTESGTIGELDLDEFQEYGSTMQGIATSAPIAKASSDKRRLFMSRFELDIESGVGLTTGQGSDPQVELDWSDDGGHTWSNRKPWRSMGALGKRRTRLIWRRMGSFRERVLRVTVADPVKRAFIAAHADIS